MRKNRLQDGRWILAIDGGCSSCQSVGESVRRAAEGTGLEVRHLGDVEIVGLRQRSIGDQPPWLPTLISADGDDVRAWTGNALSRRLARLLGPVKSVGVVKAIAQDAPVSGERRRFLKAIPGAAAATVLLGGGVAFASEEERTPQAQFVRITGQRAAKIIQHVVTQSNVVDFGNEVGIDPSAALQSAVVEVVPADAGIAARWYVSATWLDDADRLARTSHLVSRNGDVDSNVFIMTKADDPEVTWGKLGGRTQSITESEAATYPMPLYDLGCVADCAGVSGFVLALIMAGCGAACAVTVGTGCLVCIAAATGFSGGSFIGCVTAAC